MLIKKLLIEIMSSDKFSLDLSGSVDMVQKEINIALWLTELVPQLNQLVNSSYSRSQTNLGDFEFYKDSSYLKFSYGYYGQIFVNHSQKKIIFVIAGTKAHFLEKPEKLSNWNVAPILDFALDAFNDFQLALGLTPLQYQKGSKVMLDHFVKEIKESEAFGSNMQEYSMFFVGHSLGAALSDITALYAIHHHRDAFGNIVSVTLENPGSKKLMCQMHDTFNQRKTEEEIGPYHNLSDLTDHFFVVNNKANLINASMDQFGWVYENITSYNYAADAKHFVEAETGGTYYLYNLLEDVINKEKSVFSTVEKVYHLLQHAFKETVSLHKNNHFDNCTLERSANWPKEKKYTETLNLAYNKFAKAIVDDIYSGVIETSEYINNSIYQSYASFYSNIFDIFYGE
ncbi:MAG: hypothetical protein SFT93_01295 [Rickettsiaceae bacterium]|nr:hypothetical protein [Rickettsiaceae bacterium]